MFSLLRNAYLHCKERADRSFPVLMLGLDNAGKTTVIHALQGVVPRGASAPTVGYAPHTVAVSGLDLTFIDLGGGRRIRGIWKHYYAEVSDFLIFFSDHWNRLLLWMLMPMLIAPGSRQVFAVVFVVDAHDGARLEEAAEQLQAALADERLAGKPLLVLANKHDLEGAADAEQVAAALGIGDRVGSGRSKDARVAEISGMFCCFFWWTWPARRFATRPLS